MYFNNNMMPQMPCNINMNNMINNYNLNDLNKFMLVNEIGINNCHINYM